MAKLSNIFGTLDKGLSAVGWVFKLPLAIYETGAELLDITRTHKDSAADKKNLINLNSATQKYLPGHIWAGHGQRAHKHNSYEYVLFFKNAAQYKDHALDREMGLRLQKIFNVQNIDLVSKDIPAAEKDSKFLCVIKNPDNKLILNELQAAAISRQLNFGLYFKEPELLSNQLS